MAVVIRDDGWVSDDFEMGQEPLVFKDAIVMPKDQYDLLTPEQLDAMKLERYNNWIAAINSQSDGAVNG